MPNTSELFYRLLNLNKNKMIKVKPIKWWNLKHRKLAKIWTMLLNKIVDENKDEIACYLKRGYVTRSDIERMLENWLKK